MNLMTFVNVIKLILHNLENTKFFDEIPYNMLIGSSNTFYSTVYVQKWSRIFLCQFEENRSDALLKWHNLENMEFSVEFLRKS